MRDLVVKKVLKLQTMSCELNALLGELIPLNDRFEEVQYDSMMHHEIVPQIFSRTFKRRAWGEKWDQFEGFYSDGVFLIYEKVEKFYVGFIVSYIRDDVPYIAALGVMEDFRGLHLGMYMVQRVAQHYAKMGYKNIWVDIKPHSSSFEAHCVQMGFKEKDEA